MAEANAQGCEIDRLKGVIAGKSAPLKVAQTRLNMRTQRIRRLRNISHKLGLSCAKLRTSKNWSKFTMVAVVDNFFLKFIYLSTYVSICLHLLAFDSICCIN